MKAKLIKNFKTEDDNGNEVTIGAGTVIAGPRAKDAIKAGAAVEEPDNAPDFNPIADPVLPTGRRKTVPKGEEPPTVFEAAAEQKEIAEAPLNKAMSDAKKHSK